MVKKLLYCWVFLSSLVCYGQTYIMSNSPLNACSGTYLDPGGTGNYVDNSNFTQTICSNAGNCVFLTFSSFALENNYDYLTVYDGPNTSSPQVPGSPFTGSANPGTLTSTSGCLTLVFTSDFSVTAAGWSGTLACGTCPPPPPPPPPQDLTHAWIQKTSVPAQGRHRSVAITIGNRAYAGLGHVNSTGNVNFGDWWEFDPGTASWTQKADYLGGPTYHGVGFTIGNYGYVGTGRNSSLSNTNTFFRYDPITNTWLSIASLPASARRGAVAFTINNKGYVGTGSGLKDFWEYNPTTNSWTQKADLTGPGRTSAVGFAIDSMGYIGTGQIGGNTGDFWQYSPSTNTWAQKATLPGLPRMEAAGFVLNGLGYLGTGDNYSSGDNYKDFWRYNPSTNQWTQIADFGGTARRYLTCFVIGNRAYGVFGTNGTNFNDLWEYGSETYNDVTGIDEEEKESVTINITAYPNPFTEKLTLSGFPVNSNAILRIMDITGKLVYKTENISKYEIVLERGEMADGIYFWELTVNGTRTTGKIIAR